MLPEPPPPSAATPTMWRLPIAPAPVRPFGGAGAAFVQVEPPHWKSPSLNQPGQRRAVVEHGALAIAVVGIELPMIVHLLP